jgi:succinyl-CoA synthetase alpha subunit
MIVRKHEKVVIQGITGKQGTFWTERMQEYGTTVTGGIHPKKAGAVHLGVPVHASATDAMLADPFDVAALFVPPMGAKLAALDAINAGVKKLVIMTEHIPVHDVMEIVTAGKDAGTQIIGPNTTGVATPGECFVGFMPAFNPTIMKPGPIGVISRSGSLATLICFNLTSAGLGQSAFMGIGGDPVIGTTTREALEILNADENTKGIFILGEIGGTMEEDAAEYIKGMRKPVVSYIVGGAAPEGKRMGHAGAIVTGTKGSYKSKRKALETAGAVVLDTPSDVGRAMNEALG